MRKIGDISKIFNYYDAEGKYLSTEIQNWVAAFEDGVSRDIEEVVEAEVSTPKKNSK